VGALSPRSSAVALDRGDRRPKPNGAGAKHGARLRADRLAEGDAPQRVERHWLDLTSADDCPGAGWSACSTLAGLDLAPGSRVWQAERAMAMQSWRRRSKTCSWRPGIGLGACWMCAPLFCPEAVRRPWTCPAIGRRRRLLTLGALRRETKCFSAPSHG